MNNINELPEEYRKLAEENENSKSCFGRSKNNNDLLMAFTWYFTRQGWHFWNKVYRAQSPSELPSIPKEE